jgi:hypothetical protein
VKPRKIKTERSLNDLPKDPVASAATQWLCLRRQAALAEATDHARRLKELESKICAIEDSITKADEARFKQLCNMPAQNISYIYKR